MEFRTIEANELQMWSEHCREVFNQDTGKEHGDSFLQMHEKDPWKDLGSILVAVHDGELVSSVSIFYRIMMLGGEQVKMGAIGAVCTKPEYRGRGLASRLLQHAADFMRDHGIQISLLTSGIWSFYEKLGWQNVDWIWKVADFEVDHAEPEEFVVRPISSMDMDAIKLLYSTQIQNYNGPIIRNDEYWKLWTQIESKPCWVAVDQAGIVIAYLWLYIRAQDNYICVMEYGESKSNPSIIKKMIHPICSSYDWTTCRLRYQSGVPLDLEAKETTTYPGLMYRLITPIRVHDEHILNTGQLIQFLNRNNKPDSSDYLNWDQDNV